MQPGWEIESRTQGSDATWTTSTHVEPSADHGRTGERGFSLIEALVALAVVAVTLSAIGEVFGSNMQTTRRLEDRLALDGEAQVILTALPDRDQIRSGPYTGAVDGNPWKMQIMDLTAGNPGKPQIWRPVAIVVTVRTPGGLSLRLDTIRLARAPASGG